MTEQHEQRYCIKFCIKLGDTQVETIRKIQQAFGDDAMSNSRIKEWYNRFKDGRTSVDSEPRSGRLSTSRNENVIEQVRTLVMEDRRITVRELANEIGVRIGSVHLILTEDFGMRRVSAKFVPKLLAMEQKQRRLEMAQDMLDNANSNPNFLNTAPYSPDTAPCDFWLFSKLKMPLKGTRFESREDIMQNATARLITSPKDAFQKCFQQWR
ncbi:hypothetical protein B7P43_G08778 [Cryptotermes secundus]|uniref:Mos1 transposase HTH domain-containing protein n=1 Tax=Cryptotermes secundus TaxID=105785 RepID=A0A2J7RQC3_9NEOP|nr:hypothetical protein B7P43_G08778 [Cryptotermes secundus]